MATLNPAVYFGLRERGIVAPGRAADLWLVRDLVSFETVAVVKGGRIVWSHGEWRDGADGLASFDGCGREAGGVPGSGKDGYSNTVHLPPGLPGLLRIPAHSARARVIGVLPGQIVTRALELCVRIEEDGRADVADRAYRPAGESGGPASGAIAKLAVVERHGRRGSVGSGLVSGLGIRAGAMASTVAHDSHNLIIAGTSDRDMLAAAGALLGCGGGFCVVRDGTVAALLPLPFAGLMSGRPAGEVARGIREVNTAARELGCGLESPMMALSFLALPVIPELKLTDLGLFDVRAFRHVPLWLD